MDFAAQLANLDQSAARAAAQEGNRRRRDRSPNDPTSRQYRHHQRPRYEQPHGRQDSAADVQHRTLDPLEEMKRLGYRVDPPVWTAKTDRSRPHLCLLAITIDDLPYEHVWRAWAAAAAATANENGCCLVSLVCHAKFPDRVQSPWLKQRLLLVKSSPPPPLGEDNQQSQTGSEWTTNHTLPPLVYHSRVPEWGSIDICRAMMDCLHDGLQIGTAVDSHDDERYSPRRFVIHESGIDMATMTIPTVDKFIFISESCLPVTTLTECIAALLPVCSATTAAPPTEAAVSAQSTKWSNANSTASMLETNESDNAPLTPDLQAPDKVQQEGGAATAAAVYNNDDDPWDASWINARNLDTPGTPCNKYERDQFDHIHRMVPTKYRYKADQWMVLSRRHASAIVHLDPPPPQRQQIASPPRNHHGHRHRPPETAFWTAFTRINASDEMYFPTALAVLRILQDPKDNVNHLAAETVHSQQEDPNRAVQLSTETVKRQAVTFTDWSQGMRNPATFTRGASDFQAVAARARRQGCLLARKFALGPGLSVPNETTTARTGQITVDEWKDIVARLAAAELGTK
jgi:Core-2/I-Branching enzyme